MSDADTGLSRSAADRRREPREVRVVISFGISSFAGEIFSSSAARDTRGTVYGVDNSGASPQVLLSSSLAVFEGGLSHYVGGFFALVSGFIAIKSFGYISCSGDERPMDRSPSMSVRTNSSSSRYSGADADIFPCTGKRRVGFISRGRQCGAISAPSFEPGSASGRSKNCVYRRGFTITAFLVRLLEVEKRKLVATGEGAQKTTLDHRLGGNPFDGFMLVFRSGYLLMIALFVLLMTWISTVIYFQLGDLISREFASPAARTQAYASIDLATNTFAMLIQLLGTGRFIRRFGVTTVCSIPS